MPGHWEGDLVIGKDGKTAVATLVERNTRYVMLARLGSDRSSPRVIEALKERITELPAHLVRSLTWDQGSEMFAHAKLKIDADIDVYFCDPHSPWQRGTNENTNGLLRQYFPKGTDLSFHGPGLLANVADELNRRPRKRHNWATPTEILAKLLAEQPNPGVSLTS